MRATLYQAIGIPQSASDDEVRAALRAQIRKYFAKTRDGHGNVEEALRFINHASRILTDPERRAQYDHDLAASNGTVDERIQHVVNHAAGRMRIAPTFGSGLGVAPTSVGTLSATGGLEGPGFRPAHHPGLTERVVAFRHSTAIAISLCALFGVIIAAAVALSTPADAVQAAKQVLIWLTVSLLALTVVYAVVHGVAWSQRRRSIAVPTLVPPPELAILNWRRQKTVFLGTSQPQEDASWVFQLRMAELERAKSGRTSEPHPWSRLGARLFDYAIWGLVLAAIVSESRALGLAGGTVFEWITHPLVAPVLITLTWVPVEALLIATTHTTPGKWLFGVYLQFSISDAYASRDRWTQGRRAARRAFRVWWNGVGCGFPLVAPILIAIAYEKVAEHQEAAWDFAEDCLVTHGPPGGLNTATGVAGLAAMLWLYGVAWHQPMADSFNWARTSIAAALPSAPALWRQGIALGSGMLGSLPAGGNGVTRGADSPPIVPGNGAPRPVVAAAVRPVPTAAVTGISASQSGDRAGTVRVLPRAPAPAAGAGAAGAPLDPEVAALFAARQKRINAVSVDGPRLLEARSYRQAAEVCREWVDLELGNAKAWRCLGRALQAQGQHQDAISAFRKAKQYEPGDSALDAAIARSQQGIVNDFVSRSGN